MIPTFGIGGLVDTYVNQIPFGVKSRLGGKASFYYAAARAQVVYRNQRVRLSYDGEEPFETVVNHVAVANGQYFGGGMKIAPEADPSDGCFDIVTITASRARILALTADIYRGTHVQRSGITVHRGRSVTARATRAGEVLIDVDGEQPGQLPLEVTLLPRALALLT